MYVGFMVARTLPPPPLGRITMTGYDVGDPLEIGTDVDDDDLVEDDKDDMDLPSDVSML
jgi:hypothetical protein